MKIDSCLIAVLLLVASHATLHAQSRAVSWSEIAGGGYCHAGRFRLNGSVGQADAGSCTGGTFVQQGGFTPAFIKTVGPPLTMRVNGNQIILIWPNVCTGFVAEGAITPSGPWVSLGSGTVVGVNRQVVVATVSGYYFFRLRKDCTVSCASACPQ